MSDSIMGSDLPEQPVGVASSSLPVSSQPRLGRLDGKPMKATELDRRRFSLSIESVYYYSSRSGGVGCAILLNTHLELRKGEKLSLATVPLSASPSEGDATSSSADIAEINIAGRFPKTTQWVEVYQRTGTKEILITPNIQANTGAVGAGLSSIGVNKHYSDNKSYKISLDSKQSFRSPPYIPALVGAQICAQIRSVQRWLNAARKFNDPNGLFYPPSMSLLVIVEKPTPAPAWFSFNLKLNWQLHVDLHNSLQQFVGGIQRLVAKPHAHEGWRFRIEGKYNSQAAKAALRDALNQDPPALVGLNAAARPWMAAGQEKLANNNLAMPAAVVT
ncbi:hypothetical protein HWV62_12236 [Athelia sp. TMB]|nr:hypothetical protein HWV62_12236 [Athelia sp. TMB]